MKFYVVVKVYPWSSIVSQDERFRLRNEKNGSWGFMPVFTSLRKAKKFASQDPKSIVQAIFVERMK